MFYPATRIIESIVGIELPADPTTDRATFWVSFVGSRVGFSVAFFHGTRVIRDKSLGMERLRSPRVCLFRFQVTVVWQEPPITRDSACRARGVSENHPNGLLHAPDDLFELLECLSLRQDSISESRVSPDVRKGVGVGSERESHDVAAP